MQSVTAVFDSMLCIRVRLVIAAICLLLSFPTRAADTQTFGIATAQRVELAEAGDAGNQITLILAANEGDVLRVEAVCGLAPDDSSVSSLGFRPAVQGAAQPLAPVPFTVSGRLIPTTAVSVGFWRVTATTTLTLTLETDNAGTLTPCTVTAFPISSIGKGGRGAR